MSIESFDDIVRRHETWLPMLRDNPKMKRILLCAYPDKAHFIYELLQNAEDARATYVGFSLYEDRLEVVHNGRDFSLEDINAITSIGQSQKDNDDTTIGQFGIGFKAVFAYTDTPEIQSGKYHFCIKEMILPVALNTSYNLNKNETRFIFPFNKGNPEKAVKEIENGLRALRDTSLLFLTNIRFVLYSFAGKTAIIERKEQENNIVEIRSIGFNGTTNESKWIRFSKNIDILDDDENLKNLYISLAYLLQMDDDGKLHIVPDDNAKVSIFFPAVKEYSGLKFHIHAPFASTISRDSVRDCVPNEKLCTGIAELAVESLTSIRACGLLDMSFLEALPNSGDALGKMYIQIREKLLEAFRTEAFTPVSRGGYAPARELFSAPKDVRDVFSDEDMNELIGAKLPVWAASAPLKNVSRADKFMESLQIRSWGWNDLKNIDYEAFDALLNMLKTRNDLWCMHFYAFVGEKFNSDYAASFRWPFSNLRSEKCIRDFSGNMMEPSQIFFPAPEEKRLPTDIHTVKKEILGRSESQQRNVRNFLEQMGVREYDETTIVELALQKYKYGQSGPSNFEEHIRDIKLFLDYFQDHPSSSAFSSCRILYGEKGDNVYLSDFSDLYIDEPFEKTGIKEVASILGKQPLSFQYATRLLNNEKKAFVDFAKTLGVCDRIKVEKTFLYYHPRRSALIAKDYGRKSEYSREEDFTIKHLTNILDIKDIQANRLIWQAIIEAPQEASQACYRRTLNSTTYRDESSLVIILKDTAWIPDKDGVFHKPQDIIPSQLHDGFIYDESNGLLAAIEFGKNFYANQEIHQKQEEAAQQIGFESIEEATEIAKLKQELNQAGLDIKSILRDQLSRHRELHHRNNVGEFPRGQSRDSDRHYDKAREKISEAPQKQYEVRPRSVKTSGSSIDYKTYLREEYTNQEGALFCQMCQHVMPFQELNGTNYYFEGRQLLAEIAQECEANHLALCPLCAAKYKELAQRSISAMDDLKQALREADIEGALEIPLSLGEKEGIAKLRFTQRHLIAIQAMLDS